MTARAHSAMRTACITLLAIATGGQPMAADEVVGIEIEFETRLAAPGAAAMQAMQERTAKACEATRLDPAMKALFDYRAPSFAAGAERHGTGKEQWYISADRAAKWSERYRYEPQGSPKTHPNCDNWLLRTKSSLSLQTLAGKQKEVITADLDQGRATRAVLPAGSIADLVNGGDKMPPLAGLKIVPGKSVQIAGVTCQQFSIALNGGQLDYCEVVDPQDLPAQLKGLVLERVLKTAGKEVLYRRATRIAAAQRIPAERFALPQGVTTDSTSPPDRRPRNGKGERNVTQ